jgi:hypothetical protein
MHRRLIRWLGAKAWARVVCAVVLLGAVAGLVRVAPIGDTAGFAVLYGAAALAFACILEAATGWVLQPKARMRWVTGVCAFVFLPAAALAGHDGWEKSLGFALAWPSMAVCAVVIIQTVVIGIGNVGMWCVNRRRVQRGLPTLEQAFADWFAAADLTVRVNVLFASASLVWIVTRYAAAAVAGGDPPDLAGFGNVLDNVAYAGLAIGATQFITSQLGSGTPKGEPPTRFAAPAKPTTRKPTTKAQASRRSPSKKATKQAQRQGKPKL